MPFWDLKGCQIRHFWGNKNENFWWPSFLQKPKNTPTSLSKNRANLVVRRVRPDHPAHVSLPLYLVMTQGWSCEATWRVFSRKTFFFFFPARNRRKLGLGKKQIGGMIPCPDVPCALFYPHRRHSSHITWHIDARERLDYLREIEKKKKFFLGKKKNHS